MSLGFLLVVMAILRFCFVFSFFFVQKYIYTLERPYLKCINELMYLFVVVCFRSTAAEQLAAAAGRVLRLSPCLFYVQQ